MFNFNAVPQPTVMTESDSGLYLVTGDALSLACVVQLDAFKYMDTGAVVNVTWRSPRGEKGETSQLVPSSATPLLISDTLELQVGSLGDAGNYSCTVTLGSQQGSVLLAPSAPVESAVEVNVLESRLHLCIQWLDSANLMRCFFREPDHIGAG